VRIESGELTHERLLEESRGAGAFVVARVLRKDQPFLQALSRRYRTRTVIGSVTIFAGRPR
jgi:hypothetical protein